jgi:hypothetical protein
LGEISLIGRLLTLGGQFQKMAEVVQISGYDVITVSLVTF